MICPMLLAVKIKIMVFKHNPGNHELEHMIYQLKIIYIHIDEHAVTSW